MIAFLGLAKIPSEGEISPERIFKKVDFPQPLAPTSP